VTAHGIHRRLRRARVQQPRARARASRILRALGARFRVRPRNAPGALDLAYGPDPRQRIDLFPAAKGSPNLLVFIHGGYWRSLDKRFFSWLAPSWVAANVSVALIGYRLCPQVRIPDIVDDVLAATHWIFAHGAGHGVGTGASW
jgi:arylformamidase